MKILFTAVLAFFVMALAFDETCRAGMATPTEVMAKVKEAVKLIQDEGEEAALQKIRDPNGPFVWKDSYVFVLHTNGMLVAHPFWKDHEGTNVLEMKDPKGKAVFAEIIETVKDNDSGWVDYLWHKPNKRAPSHKVSFLMKVPGTDIICNAGIYDLRKEDVDKILKHTGSN